MTDLRELFQEVILEHYKKPRNKGIIENATHCADGNNTLCGDQIHLTMVLDDGRVTSIAHEGIGCAICSASSSIMSELVDGKTTAEIQELYSQFHKMAMGEIDALSLPENAEKLAVFGGVSGYPARVKCATLPWHTLDAALKKNKKAISTE